MSARFGSFEIDPQRRQLSREGQVLHLTPKAFDLLWLLVEAAPRVVPKPQIHQRLWPSGAVTDATLVGLIKEIRRALSDADPIRTVHRVGYAFDMPVTHPPAAQPAFPARHDHWLIAGERRIALAEGENIIGRDPAVNVWLDYSTVSRRHARVTVLASRTVLEDLGSKNGTSIAGVPLTGDTTLHDGDQFSCGQLQLTYRRSSAELPTATEVSRVVEPYVER